MSGVTWRPERAVIGTMTRAVAAGGPCLVGSSSARRVAVNRGGVLERWARETLVESEVVAVDDNLSLPRLFEDGEVEAFVTDSFEVRHLSRPEWPASCEPALDRKVYWVAPARAAELGPGLDRWLAEHEHELRALRRQYFGEAAKRDELDHLIDLVGRRLELMPAVAAWKAARGLAIEAPERERLVLERAATGARERGLEPDSVATFFELQVEMAKRVQRRHPAPEAELDLDTQLRPALLDLGDRILDSLAEVVPVDAGGLGLERTQVWSRYLSEIERAQLRRGLLAVERAESLDGAEPAPRSGAEGAEVGGSGSGSRLAGAFGRLPP
jgi:chorismate mutase-like protein